MKKAKGIILKKLKGHVGDTSYGCGVGGWGAGGSFSV